jgi:hypothetical protein
MSSEKMPKGYVCWNIEGLDMIESDVGKIMVSNEAIIQAIHQNVDVNVESPEVIAKLTEILQVGKTNPDTAIVDMFRRAVESENAEGDNMLLAVVGDTGSGKSHIVRWLFQQIEDDESRYIKLWVPRRENAQKFVIKEFIDDLAKLGNERAGELQAKLDATFQKSESKPEELLEDLYTNLGHHLKFEATLRVANSDLETSKRKLFLGEDGESGNRGLLWQVLNDIKNEELSNQLKNGLASFLREVVDSFSQSVSQDDKAKKPKSELTADRVRKILKDYKTLINKKLLKHEYTGFFNSSLSDVEIVTDILNEGIEFAVNSLMSTGGTNIREVFSEVREELAKHNKQLLIFVEDFSAISGSNAGLGKLQRDLMGMFTESSSNGKLAPLRVAMAITNNTYEILESNFRQRMNFVVSIDEAFKTIDGEPFAASYLRLARTSRQALEEAWENSKLIQESGQSWVPNACVSCSYQEECFETFDSDHGIGLYPLNKIAVNRMSNELRLNPRERISRMKGLLSTVSIDLPNDVMPSKSVVNFFGPLTPGDRESDQFKMLNIDFVGLKGNNPQESKSRLQRYVYNWTNREKPGEVESRVFGLPFFDSVDGDNGGGNGPVIEGKTIIDPVEPRPIASELQLKLNRVNAWESADVGADLLQVLTSNQHEIIRNSVVQYVKSAFGRQFTGATLDEYKERIGLRFVPASVRVEGIMSQGTGVAELLHPYFEIQRDQRGADILRGLLCLEAMKNGEEIDLCISPRQQPVVISIATGFIREIVESLVGIVHQYEAQSQSIWDVAAKTLQFVRITNPDLRSLAPSVIVNSWLDNSIRPQDEIGRLTKASSEFLASTMGLAESLDALCQVTQEETTTSKRPTYRRISELMRRMDTCAESPVDILKSIQLKGDSGIKWSEELKVAVNRMLDNVSTEATNRLLIELTNNARNLEDSLKGDLEADLRWLRQNINALMARAAFTVSSNELLTKTEEFEESVINELVELSHVDTLLLNGLKADDLLMSGFEIDHVNRVAASVRYLQEQLTYALDKLNSQLVGGGKIEIPEVIDLGKLTTIEGLEEIGSLQ